MLLIRDVRNEAHLQCGPSLLSFLLFFFFFFYLFYYLSILQTLSTKNQTEILVSLFSHLIGIKNQEIFIRIQTKLWTIQQHQPQIQSKALFKKKNRHGLTSLTYPLTSLRYLFFPFTICFGKKTFLCDFHLLIYCSLIVDCS